MNSKYKVTKFSSKNFNDTEDLISIEEPLEISLKYKLEDKWINQNLSITMRTPGHDEDLVTGFLFNEQIITSLNDIDSIESYGDKVGQYNIQNKILATIVNSENVNIAKIKRDFFVFNRVFRDKVSVAINKICLIKLIDQLQFTISSKHVLPTKNDLREI